MNDLLKQSVNVYIVDDEAEIRESLSRFFTYHGCQVEVFADAKSYLDQLDQSQVGCLVSDIDMEGMSGLGLQRHLQEINCIRPTIFMTGHGSVNLAVKAMKLGATDFIEKPFDPNILLKKIKICIDSNRKQIELLNRYRTLTKKECEIFECVAKGKKNKEMANNLCISMPTVEAHRSRVMKKMQAKSLSELVKMSVILSK
ncbi:response regulator [Candidatus Thioglobus autotrophicus]|uniref:response regulator transcription factor n=1 Tax=Candidatus Thioglobus autotrophicus TaxID=1705394 RepID=UPI00299DB1BA|nr:response regulator [Candidatus Thioglobus autotrophicus]WPE16890.1 response regulator [Candidatus Thioglobus autotrophicus]